jgi:hypothetical protein
MPISAKETRFFGADNTRRSCARVSTKRSGFISPYRTRGDGENSQRNSSGQALSARKTSLGFRAFPRRRALNFHIPYVRPRI